MSHVVENLLPRLAMSIPITQAPLHQTPDLLIRGMGLTSCVDPASDTQICCTPEYRAYTCWARALHTGPGHVSLVFHSKYPQNIGRNTCSCPALHSCFMKEKWVIEERFYKTIFLKPLSDLAKTVNKHNEECNSIINIWKFKCTLQKCTLHNCI